MRRLALAVAFLAACAPDGAPIGAISGGIEAAPPAPNVTKVDVVLMIDNSRSMADKQVALAQVVDSLVYALENPPCVDPKGQMASTQPADRDQACPEGTEREFIPVIDIHFGVITSSLGGEGSDSCPIEGTGHATNDEHAHLVNRGQGVSTYDDLGFLAWDPGQKLSPPGQKDPAALTNDLGAMVVGVGQDGCGYEQPLEAAYRFLVDPEPPASVDVSNNGEATFVGVDDVLLAQRATFLRPNSAVVVVLLTDENDCSIDPTGQGYFLWQAKLANGAFHMPRAREACATNPSDNCCFSCASADIVGCPGKAQDSECIKGDYGDLEDPLNLRCWQPKRRFGIDPLYPVDRYVRGFSAPTIVDRHGATVANPLFAKVGDTPARDPGLVFVAGLVGVPWQDVAQDPKDLGQGIKTASELTFKDAALQLTPWDVMLGKSGGAPADAHMIESVVPRTGSNPYLKTPLAPPGSPPDADPINGHEWTPTMNTDLQYACIFPLPMSRDCSMVTDGCDCDGTSDSALCSPQGSMIQVAAKAYPSLRELQMLKSLGAQAVVGSICPAQLTNKLQNDFAYRPIMRGLITALKTRLRSSPGG